MTVVLDTPKKDYFFLSFSLSLSHSLCLSVCVCLWILFFRVRINNFKRSPKRFLSTSPSHAFFISTNRITWFDGEVMLLCGVSVTMITGNIWEFKRICSVDVVVVVCGWRVITQLTSENISGHRGLFRLDVAFFRITTVPRTEIEEIKWETSYPSWKGFWTVSSTITTHVCIFAMCCPWTGCGVLWCYQGWGDQSTFLTGRFTSREVRFGRVGLLGWIGSKLVKMVISKCE